MLFVEMETSREINREEGGLPEGSRARDFDASNSLVTIYF
jgi:hypothetical protein